MGRFDPCGCYFVHFTGPRKPRVPSAGGCEWVLDSISRAKVRVTAIKTPPFQTRRIKKFKIPQSPGHPSTSRLPELKDE
jgi:hypothetical protein